MSRSGLSTAPSTVAILAIGDEVLRGEVVNGNAAFLADHLFDLGYVIREHLVVSDEPAEIRAALERLAARVDTILVTGGLGPTDDDRTVDVVCSMLGVEAETHRPSAEAMERAFAARGYALTPNNLRQVRFPSGGEALPNPVGIAPGFRVTIAGSDAYFLPGVPREMQRIFGDHIAPGLAATLTARGFPPPAVRTFHVYGMGESHVDHRLAGLVDGLTDVSLHYRTAAPENHVKLVVRGADAAQNAATLERLSAEVHRRLGAVVYGVDDVTFPQAVLRAFRRAQATLALAESCTGGYAGQVLTSEPGASDVFAGGVVSYANEVKAGVLGVRRETLERYGAVSEECAREMADGVRRISGATVAVSITGIAGADKDGRALSTPEPASPLGAKHESAKPVGLVCFGLSGPDGTRSETKQFAPGRERIRRAAAHHALDMARRHLERDAGNGRND